MQAYFEGSLYFNTFHTAVERFQMLWFIRRLLFVVESIGLPRTLKMNQRFVFTLRAMLAASYSTAVVCTKFTCSELRVDPMNYKYEC